MSFRTRFGIGYDVFYFYVDHENGVYVRRVNNNVYKDTTYFNDADAAYWIINFGNMDYLKTSDGTSCPNSSIKLTFDGSHSCK